MFIDQNGNQINIFAPFMHGDVRYADLRDPNLRVMFGITEIPDPTPPEDYSDATYFRTEQVTPPYVVFTRKPQEMIDQATKARVQAQITALEQQSLLPRTVRDAILTLLPPTDPTCLRIKAIEDQITTLRAQL